jgi:hypothetical protein
VGALGHSTDRLARSGARDWLPRRVRRARPDEAKGYRRCTSNGGFAETRPCRRPSCARDVPIRRSPWSLHAFLVPKQAHSGRGRCRRRPRRDRGRDTGWGDFRAASRSQFLGNSTGCLVIGGHSCCYRYGMVVSLTGIFYLIGDLLHQVDLLRATVDFGGGGASLVVCVFAFALSLDLLLKRLRKPILP